MKLYLRLLKYIEPSTDRFLAQLHSFLSALPQEVSRCIQAFAITSVTVWKGVGFNALFVPQNDIHIIMSNTLDPLVAKVLDQADSEDEDAVSVHCHFHSCSHFHFHIHTLMHIHHIFYS